ncbi:glycosyltransferase [Candidatus Woesearchaeota archaeon]|nr:glycosyltransferase [Candidatus Woesearchaeota archaeon]
MANNKRVKRVSVVSPARNEEGNIKEFVARTAAALEKLNCEYQIIVVDDASTDKTPAILEKLKSRYKELKVVHNKKAKGITNSLNVGFKYTSYPTIIFLPSDLESNPSEDIPDLLESYEQGNDFVIGWRYNKRDNRIKRATTFLFNKLVGALFKDVKLHDLGWVKCFDREILDNIEPLRSDWHRFLAVLAITEGYRVKEIKTKYYPRKRGVSKFGKFGLGRIQGAFFDLLAIKFFSIFSKKPMHMFGLMGLIFTLIGLIFGVYLLYLHFISFSEVDKKIPFVILTSLFILVGTVFFSIGILAEYLVSIMEKLKKIK